MNHNRVQLTSYTNSSTSSVNEGKSKVQCHVCSEYGHMSFKCEQLTAFIKQEMETRKNGNVEKSDTKTSSMRALFASSNFVTSSPLKVQGDAMMKSEMELLVDSGMTQHMTPSNEGFVQLCETDRKIEMANKMTIELKGIGDIPARLSASDDEIDVIF